MVADAGRRRELISGRKGSRAKVAVMARRRTVGSGSECRVSTPEIKEVLHPPVAMPSHGIARKLQKNRNRG